MQEMRTRTRRSLEPLGIALALAVALVAGAAFAGTAETTPSGAAAADAPALETATEVGLFTPAPQPAESGICGNYICEPEAAENCLNCPSDCRGVQTGKPSDRFCCGDGAGENPVDCSDYRCTAPRSPIQCCNSLLYCLL